MEKYFFINWATFPFKRKTFDGQMDRYVKVCVVNAENPQKVLDIIPIYGNEDLSGIRDVIRLIYDIERGVEIDDASKKLLNNLQKPIMGDFVEIKRLHGPLFHQFTPDDARYGLCPEYNVWKPERDSQGKVKEYLSMRVFTISLYDSDICQYHYAKDWSPNKMYYKYFGYRYKPLSMLTEPIQL